jgi:excisionase family DNA binding protein
MKTMKIEKQFLTVKETAEYLGTTPQGVHTMAMKRKIRFYKPSGKRIYFAIEDIEEYITGGEVFETQKNEKQ